MKIDFESGIGDQIELMKDSPPNNVEVVVESNKTSVSMIVMNETAHG